MITKQRAAVQDSNRELKGSRWWISRMVTAIKKPMAWVETRGHREPTSSDGAHHERREGGSDEINQKLFHIHNLQPTTGFKPLMSGVDSDRAEDPVDGGSEMHGQRGDLRRSLNRRWVVWGKKKR
ncbi:hypothetical protein V6N12_042252 [Hibiscus sabdariffa]|uniref:Uncharacterized protein n=1 Tax=Hibiscus sabdariffa TaxID=183260 RepID=A0ABR2EE88_9ROSI